MSRRLPLLLTAASLVASCTERDPPEVAEAPLSCEAPGVRAVVTRFGERLKHVSLQAPDSAIASQLREAYAALVTADLLESWIVDPESAPGREVSSPWPERIEISSVSYSEGAGCRVAGEVVFLTSVELARGGVAWRGPVTLGVVDEAGWRISDYEGGVPASPVSPRSRAPGRGPDSAPPPAPDGTTAEAAEVIARYYAAIAARDYPRAYGLWANDGAASGHSLEEFARGFAETQSVEVEIGEAGRVEPAAGSRYVAVPVVIRATTAEGSAERFEGAYTLRRSVVPGATTEQRAWRIYSAEIARSR